MADMNGQVALGLPAGSAVSGLAISERLMNLGIKVAAGCSTNHDDARLFADKHADHGAITAPPAAQTPLLLP